MPGRAGTLTRFAGRHAPPSALRQPRYRRAVLLYDRLYRMLHRLDTPAAVVGPVLRVEVHRCWRTRLLPDGTRLRPGDRIGALHLNNARVAALHEEEDSRGVGLELRRQMLGSLRALADLAAPGGPLAGVAAFAAQTILHSGLHRLGFLAERDGWLGPRLVAVYQRALLASLHPDGVARIGPRGYRRARRLWLSRSRLLERYGRNAGSGRSSALPSP